MMTYKPLNIYLKYDSRANSRNGMESGFNPARPPHIIF